MNSIETTPRFERKFDQDRVEDQPVSSPPRPLNTLRTTKSAPVSSIPRESLLVRSPTSLLTSTVDHGLMDIWVDDGTNGNIDDTVRLLRFSTAASAIDGIFYSPRSSRGSIPAKTEKPTCDSLAPANHTHLSPQTSGTMAVSSHTSNTNAEKPLQNDGSSRGSEKGSEATEDVSVARKEAASMVKQQLDILETEPVTPPRADGNGLGEGTDSSETPSPAKAASLEYDTSGSLEQDPASKNSVVPAGSAHRTEPVQESTPPIRRRLSAFFSSNDETPEVGAAPQPSGIQPELRGTKRESKLLLMNVFKRSSITAVKTPPQPPIDSVNSKTIKEQPDGRRTEKLLHTFEPKSMPKSGIKQPPVKVAGKQLCDDGKEEGAQDAEAAESFNADSTDDQASPNGSERPKILNFFKRRSTVERPIPVDVENGSGQNTVGSNEQDEPPTTKGPRKLVMLVKKLSSGLRDRVGGEKKADRPSGKVPMSTAAGATVSPEGEAHSGTPDIRESPATERKRPRPLAHQPASSGGSRNATPEQPTQSTSDEQAQFTKGDRQSLWRLFKGFSSGSKERASESNPEGQDEVAQEIPNKGAFFAKLFKRKSTNAEEKESETGNTPCPERDDAGDTPASSTPPESQTRWSQLSQKVTRFLGMLVH